MWRAGLCALGLVAAGALPAGATTVTSNTFPGICNVVVTLHGSPASGGTVVLYQGALGRGGAVIEVFPNQGNQVCYTRSSDPNNCATGMTPSVCAPVTGSPTDVLDIR